jgi:hypothetical protein
MARQRFIIAPIETGLQDNVKPWLIPDDAFKTLKNAYVYRGRLRKRFGSRLLDESVETPQLASRLRIKIGVTNGSGNLGATALPMTPVVGQLFSADDVIFTVYQNGSTLVGRAGSTTTATGTVSFGGATFAIGGSDATIAGADVYFYPALPVMGLLTLETNEINDDGILGFDTMFAYTYVSGGWERLALGTSTWTGDDSQFFWGTTYYGTVFSDPRFFVVNYNVGDGVRNYNPATFTWATVTYVTTGTDTIQTARMVIIFKNRLLLLNTWELVSAVSTAFPGRIRYSQIGDLISAANTFSEANGRGGFLDAPTKEVIVSARIIKDRLIIFFERSTWELVYQGDQISPFAFQKIDSELGAESTFASVIFGTDIVGVGNVGIHACNGAYVQRIDDKIPNLVFEVHNLNSGVERVYGVRDFESEMIYWTFPDTSRNPNNVTPRYPNQILVFNYRNGSWSINDDTITCFGYFQQQDLIIWSSIAQTWEDYDEKWNSGDFQALTRQVIAGNQEGFTFFVNINLARNAPALQITQLSVPVSRPRLTIIDHNFLVGEFIRIEDCIGNTYLNDKNYEIVQVVDKDNIEIIEPAFSLSPAYKGGGTVTRISQIDIWTKDYDFFVKEGTGVFIPRVDFLVDRSENGQVTIDLFTASSSNSSESFILETSPYALYPNEASQTRLWHPVYTQSQGDTVQLRIYLSTAQMLDFEVILADFQLNAMVFHAQENGIRLGG